jgi:hypothetical protein
MSATVTTTENTYDPTKRPHGEFIPDPNLIGYLLGKGGQSLRMTAKSVPGAFVKYNDEKHIFDIWARSLEDVNNVRKALYARQLTAGEKPVVVAGQKPMRMDAGKIHAGSGANAGKIKQTIKIGAVTLTVTQAAGQPPVMIDIVSNELVRSGPTTGPMIQKRPFKKPVIVQQKVAEPAEQKTTYSTMAARTPVAGPAVATAVVAEPSLKTSGGTKSWAEREEEEELSDDTSVEN